MEETDEIVYRRFLKTRGEEDLRLLFDRHREGLFLFLLSIVRSEEDAEDLMMDVFSVVASGTAAFSGRSSFTPSWTRMMSAGNGLRRLSTGRPGPAACRRRSPDRRKRNGRNRRCFRRKKNGNCTGRWKPCRMNTARCCIFCTSSR